MSKPVGREKVSYPPSVTFHTGKTRTAHPSGTECLLDQAQGRGLAGHLVGEGELLCLCPDPGLFGLHLEPCAKPPLMPPGLGKGQMRDREKGKGPDFWVPFSAS